MSPRDRLRHEAPALAALVLLAVAQLWPAVGPGRLPESLDLMLQYVPNAAYLQRSLTAASLPLWNPYLGTGMPFAADPGAGVWYLPSWPLLVVLPLFAAVRASLWLHLLWAALGAYAFGRVSLGVGRTAAFFAATAFALTTWLPGLAGMPAVLPAVAWLPWIVTLGCLASRRGGRWTALLALAGAAQLVSGWPAGAYLAWLTLGLFLLGRGPTWRGVARVTGAGVTSALLSGVLLLPAFEFLGESSYADTRSVEAAGAEGYLTFLSWLRPASGSGALESSQLYLGIAAIMLAIAGALPRDRTARTLAAIAALALVIAMGTRTPLFGALYAWLPGFRIVYLPARLGIVAAFALSGLAAIGLQRVADGRVSRKELAIISATAFALVPLTLAQFWLSEGYDNFRRLLTNFGRFAGGPYLSAAQEAQYVVVAALTLGALWLLRGRRRSLAAPALAGLLVVDVLLAHQLSRPPAFDPGRWYAPAFETAERLRAGLGYERIAGAQWHGTTHFLTDFPRSADPAQLPPNLALLVGLRDAQGYNPLLLRGAAELFAQLNLGETGGLADDHWLWVQDFNRPQLHGLAVSHVLAGGNEWRVRSRRIVAPIQVGAAPIRVAIPPLNVPPLRLHVVTYLGEGTRVRDSETVGELVVLTSAGSQRNPLRAGSEIAEWAYDRPDVAQSVAHRQAPVALRTQLVDPVGGRFSVYEYRATFDLAPGDPPTAVEVVSLLPPGGTTTLNLAGVWIEAPATFPPVDEGMLRNTSAQPRLRSSAGSATIVAETSGRIEALVESSSRATVTLADAFYPGWIARVDGREVQIDPEDGLFRAVTVPPGRRSLVFSYEPRSLAAGAVASVVGIVLAGALAFGKPLRLPRATSPSTTPMRVRRKTSRP